MLEVLRLRASGLSLQSIALRLGLRDVSEVRELLRVGLSELQSEHFSDVLSLRSLELLRIEELWSKWYPRALSGESQALELCIRLMKLRSQYIPSLMPVSDMEGALVGVLRGLGEWLASGGVPRLGTDGSVEVISGIGGV